MFISIKEDCGLDSSRLGATNEVLKVVKQVTYLM